MKRIVSIQPLPGHQLKLRFDDGVEGMVDLSGLVGRGVFAAWEDPAFFAQVKVNAHGTVEWPGEIDLCPDQLYMEATGLGVRDLFPNWQTEPVHA